MDSTTIAEKVLLTFQYSKSWTIGFDTHICSSGAGECKATQVSLC